MIDKVTMQGCDTERWAIVLPASFDDGDVQALKDAIWDMVTAGMSSDTSKNMITADTGYYMLQLCQIIEDKL